MEKKYKHKIFGFTAEKYGSSYKISTTEQRGTEMVAPWMVEQSNDWELIEDKPYFEFITEDGCKVISEQHLLNTLNVATLEERSSTAAAIAKGLGSGWKFFYHRDNLLKYIEEYKPKPKVILTTQDGIDISDPDRILYGVNIPSWKEWKGIARLCFGGEDYKVFSSEAKRDEYILQMKPLLSLSEVKSSLSNSHGYFKNAHQARRAQIDTLTELAKSKI